MKYGFQIMILLIYKITAFRITTQAKLPKTLITQSLKLKILFAKLNQKLLKQCEVLGQLERILRQLNHLLLN